MLQHMYFFFLLESRAGSDSEVKTHAQFNELPLFCPAVCLCWLLATYCYHRNIYTCWKQWRVEGKQRKEVLFFCLNLSETELEVEQSGSH